jgi:hypothetical protein
MRLSTALLLVAGGCPVAAAGDPPTVDPAGLPPRSVPEALPARPVPDWTRTHVRVGHLPGSPEMATEFLKAGYNVVILNALGRWDAVGPAAGLHPPEKVKEAAGYLRAHVEKCHKAGAKAVFYVGPVQVPVGNPAFVKAHPDWLRVRPNGKPDPTPNFANIRSGYADWLLAQLAYVTREFKADGFWFDGYAPAHLHTYDAATKAAYRAFSGGQDIPLPMSDVPDRSMNFDPVKDPEARRYLAWHEDHWRRSGRRTRRRSSP